MKNNSLLRTGLRLAAAALVAGALVLSGCATTTVAASDDTVVPEQDRYGGVLNIGLAADPLGVDAAVVNQVWRNVARPCPTRSSSSTPKRRDRAVARQELGGQGRPHLHVQAARRRHLPRRHQADGRGRQGELREPRPPRHPLECQDDRRGHQGDQGPQRVRGGGRVRRAERRLPHQPLPSPRRHRVGEDAELPVDERQVNVDGSGAFYLESFTPNQQIVIKKRRTTTGHRRTSAVRAGLPRRGRVQDHPRGVGAPWCGGQPGRAAVHLLGQRQLHRPVRGRRRLVIKKDALNPATGTELPINSSSPLLKDVRVRQALQISLDRGEFVKVTHGGNPSGQGSAQRGQPVLLGREPVPQVRPGQGGCAPQGRRLGRGRRRRHPRQGRQAPVAAGPRDGRPAVLQEQWKKIGIELRLEPPLAAEANQKLLSGEYDIAYWYHSTPDPDVLRANYGVKTGSNRSFIAADDSAGRSSTGCSRSRTRCSTRRSARSWSTRRRRSSSSRPTRSRSNDVDVWAYSPRAA